MVSPKQTSLTEPRLAASSIVGDRRPKASSLCPCPNRTSKKGLQFPRSILKTLRLSVSAVRKRFTRVFIIVVTRTGHVCLACPPSVNPGILATLPFRDGQILARRIEIRLEPDRLPEMLDGLRQSSQPC